MRAVVLVLLLSSCAPREPEPAPKASPAETPSAAPAAAPSALTPTSAGPAVPDRFTALGTEPFWAAEIDGAMLLYKTPEDQTGARVAVSRRVVGEAVELRGELAGAPLILTITAGPCSDGMSDRVYPHSVERALGGDRQRGCASAEDLRRNAA